MMLEAKNFAPARSFERPSSEQLAKNIDVWGAKLLYYRYALHASLSHIHKFSSL
jgi:hypothetical protein